MNNSNVMHALFMSFSRFRRTTYVNIFCMENIPSVEWRCVIYIVGTFLYVDLVYLVLNEYYFFKELRAA